MALLYKDQRFNSFEEFEAARVKYQEKNYVLWVIGNTTTVQAANAEIVAKGGNNLFKPELRYRYAKFTCKFGGKVRIGTGKGKRPMQATHKIGCEARLELRATRTHLVIHSISEVHNYEVTEESYKALPENRNLSAEAEEKVKLLFNGGVKPAVVRSVLRGLTGNWKNQENNGMTEKERLVDTLANLLDNDPDASVYNARDESDDLKFLFLQTSAMRRNVQMYGMVLLMDHSYKVNRNRMPVCVLMVMDGDGNGRSAGYAFVADEQQFTVSEVLTAFRESITEDVASKLTTIIIDKDPSEIAAIENVFPEVHIQLCSFHVSKTLKEKSVKKSDRVKETLDNLKYVQSEEGYTSLCTELKKMASPTFVKYFEENWEKCPQAWSYRDKKHGLNFGNTTTNRVENHNSKIKMILNSNSPLADAVEGLLNVFLNKEEDVLHREIVSAMKRSYMTTALDDPIINQILTDLKQYPANLLIWEFKQIPEEKE
ncbi:hypothetical protein KUF71_025548 [Frankliniella fusca]|uniref:MULE transposase domain-containing protein n=1 Tax=Frankliniella fusca TaxID=407009 RepID=A0AAE1I1H4_9NEOP|nr:hypothetical protein KUF71_025548 [Frankliniella fusca]